MDNSKTDIGSQLKQQLNHHFSSGLFLVKENVPGEIEQYLTAILFDPINQTSRHGIWGAEAQTISEIGKWLGWLPSQVPLLFFADTVVQEIANSFAAVNRKAAGSDRQRKKADQILKELDLAHLRKRNPYTLSLGESKIIWFINQWAKQPEYLIVSDFKAGLSNLLQNRLVQFIQNMMKVSQKTGKMKAVILGVHPKAKLWAQNLEKDGWQVLQGFLDPI